MKNLIKLTSMIVALSFSLLATAEIKVAVLNGQEAIFNTEFAQTKWKEVQEQPLVKEKIEELEGLRKDIQDLQEQFKKDAAVMSTEQKQVEQQRIREKYADHERVQRKLQGTQQEFMQRLMMEYAPRVQRILDELVKKEGYDLILDRQAAIRFNDSFNITARVTDELNKMK